MLTDFDIVEFCILRCSDGQLYLVLRSTIKVRDVS